MKNLGKTTYTPLKIATTILLLLFCTMVWSQEKTVIPVPKVQVKAHVQKNRIALRWAVDQPLAWKKTNLYGFKVTRITLSKNGVILANPKHLELGVFKPKPLAEWQQGVEEDDEFAVIAQSIYGESFEVEDPDGELAIILNQSEELDQRFSFALVAADMDYEAAKFAGWGYVDTEVKKGEKYLYRVEALTPTNELKAVGGKIEQGSVYLSVDDYEPLPRPIDFTVISSDQTAMLSWNYTMLKSVYNAYYIEKSEDGKNFTRLGDTPAVNMNDKPGKPAKRMFYVDSLAQNNRKYYYRIQGINSFGEKGNYSDMQSAMGQKVLAFVPHITNYTIHENQSATIEWEFLQEGENQINNFELHRADQVDGLYQKVKENIAKTDRKTLYGPLESSNYFKIIAKGKTGEERASFATLIQPIDSIPPAIPIELKGHIDSLGIAHIEWKANEEKDLLGYRVFRGNIQQEEYTQITVDPIVQNAFTDTVELQSLNSKVYYTIVATDKRYNMSDYSEVLALEKPDKIPPQSPIFKSYELKEGKVNLNIIKSYSNDVAKHLLYRQNLSDAEEKEKGFLLIKEFTEATDTVYQYTDEEVEKEKQYRYAVFAEDRSGLRSEVSQSLTVTVLDLRPEKAVDNLNSYIDRNNGYIEIFWKLKSDDVKEVLIYKEQQGSKPTLYKVVKTNTNRIVDENINPGNTYTYYIKGILTNAQFTTTEKIVVEF